MISRSVRLRGQLLHRRLGTWNCARRSAIGIGFETETEADIISASFASFVSLVRMLILNCEFCFDSYAASASLLFWNFAHLPLRQVQVHKFRETKRATSSQCTHLFCVNRLFPSVGPEVFMSFVTNRQGSQITDFGKLLQGGWLMRNEKPSEKKTREYYLQNVFLFARERERERETRTGFPFRQICMTGSCCSFCAFALGERWCWWSVCDRLKQSKL